MSHRERRSKSDASPWTIADRPGHRRSWLLAVLALALVFQSACGPGSVAPEVDPEEIDREVRLLLEQWVDAFETREPSAVEEVLSDRPGFVWLEDGEVRYPDRQSILSALAGFPPNLAAIYELDGIEVSPVGDQHAWARMSTRTRIEQDGVVVSAFDGVVTMLVERSSGAWRIAAAHTSNRRPR